MSTETTTDQPPVLPDTSGWVKRAPGDVIEAGTRYVVKMGGKFITTGVSDGTDGVGTAVEVLTPPPAPREPWRVISTDRDNPTLAKVMWDDGQRQGTFTGSLYVHEPTDHMAFSVGGGYSTIVLELRHITDVELLHTFDPVTHVPVERALIDEAARCVGAWTAMSIVRRLAALADGAQS